MDNPTPRDATPTLAELEGTYWRCLTDDVSDLRWRVKDGVVQVNSTKQPGAWIADPVSPERNIVRLLDPTRATPMTPAEIAATWPELAPAAPAVAAPPDTVPAKPAKQKRGKWRKRAEAAELEVERLKGERDEACANLEVARRYAALYHSQLRTLATPDPPPAAPATDPAGDDRYLDGELVADKPVWSEEYGALKVIRNAGMGLVDCIAPDGKQYRLYYSALTAQPDPAGYREGQVLGLGQTVKVYGADGEKLWQATVTQLLIEPGIKRLTVYACGLQPATGWQQEGE